MTILPAAEERPRRSGGAGRGAASIAMASFNRIHGVNPSLKYERLGPMALENHRQYCARHGLAFLCEAPETPGMAHCWGKFQVILGALEHHDWVIWADSDTLILDPSLAPDAYLACGADLVSQCPVEHFAHFGLGEDEAMRKMPVNTGAFAMRACGWSKQLLERASRLTQFARRGVLWNGIGDQEALTQALLEEPDWRAHMKYVPDLHCHPRFYRSGTLFVHLFGNRIEPVVSPALADAVITRWEERIVRGLALDAGELALLHLACTQCKPDQTRHALGDAEMILYGSGDRPSPRYL